MSKLTTNSPVSMLREFMGSRAPNRVELENNKIHEAMKHTRTLCKAKYRSKTGKDTMTVEDYRLMKAELGHNNDDELYSPEANS